MVLEENIVRGRKTNVYNKKESIENYFMNAKTSIRLRDHK